MDTNGLTHALVSQYEAALKMLRAAIMATPDRLWDSADYENQTWRLAYHAIWAVRFYLASSAEAYTPWEDAIEGAESLGGSWEEGAAVVENVHTADELVAFLDSLLAELPEAVSALPLDEGSGFEWYPFTRLELHLNTIRHTQHHTGQLIERLRSHGVSGMEWVSGAASWG